MKLLLRSLAVLLLFAPLHAQPSARVTTSLNGEWTFHRDGSKETKSVTLPTHWETHEGLKFDGIGWYEKTIELPELKPGRRLLLHFDGVATHATVYWNDKKLGEHLGAWTPFRFDVTEEVKKGKIHTIKVRVDEKVGHNTQGFLPIIAPHFGGIWQGARLIETNDVAVDDLSLALTCDIKKNWINLKVPVKGDVSAIKSITLQWKSKSPENSLIQKYAEVKTDANSHRYYFFQADLKMVKNDLKDAAIVIKDGQLLMDHLLLSASEMKDWSPHSPNGYELSLELNGENGILETIITRLAHRTIETQGDQFLLNGQPLSIRGVLNWGYYPPSLAPTPTEDQWRADLKLIKSWGFNLMKCCLWVPPKRLLEIADEEGVLIWLEYPTWHPKLTPQYQAELMQEYKEFHELDRNHPSVILRSLTCETGPGADIKVIQALYDQCKKMSGGLVVDDSSWIEWNRVFDFYDDHPYGNNHTWVATLDRLKKYIANSKYGVKSLCLGEAIAADTWVPTKPMLDAIAKAKADPKQAWSLDERGYPFWVPGFFDANRKWLERMGRVCGGEVDEDRLHRDSLIYAMLMRKYQIETYRREVPNGGAVVSVLRHFPLASMGLIDYLGKAVWDNKRLNPWGFQRDTMLLMRTERDRRSYFSGERFRGGFELSNRGPTTLRDLPLQMIFGYTANDSTDNVRGTALEETIPSLLPAQSKLMQHEMDLIPVKKPTKLNIDAHDTREPSISKSLINEWSLWVFPKVPEKSATKVVITSTLNNDVLNQLENGVKVLLQPNNKPGSFPTRSHWFLRGGPFINREHALFKDDSRFDFNSLSSMMVVLQHFDLASDVIPDINYLEEIDPILMLWDNHDIKEVKTHGLVFETRVGKGRLLVSALNHSGDTNAAGKWLLHAFQKHLESGPPPRNALKPDTIARMRAKLNEKKLDLVTKPWQFQPDGKNEGLKLGWEKTGFDDQAWKPIKIGQHWEGQGYNALDGWAWYRLSVDIPKDWKDVPMYWNTEGGDDAYELYVNGTKVGSGGDIPNKKTAFEDRTAHAIPAGVLKPGEKNVIAVRVYDWYGAGGIHRPMSLSNVPIGGIDILK